MIRLISQGPGHYEAGTEGEDDHILVYLDPTFETECDEPHPVKMRKDALRALYSDDDYGQRAFDKFVSNAKTFHGGREFTKKTKEGWVTYFAWQCEGMQVHYYSMWTVQIAGEWTDNVYDKFEHALAAVEEATGQKVKVVRKKRVSMETQHGATISTTVPEDVSQETLAALQAVGEAAARRFELIDELEAIGRALERYDELMASDDAEFVDQGLHEFHLKRKRELEEMLSV